MFIQHHAKHKASNELVGGNPTPKRPRDAKRREKMFFTPLWSRKAPNEMERRCAYRGRWTTALVVYLVCILILKRMMIYLQQVHQLACDWLLRRRYLIKSVGSFLQSSSCWQRRRPQPITWRWFVRFNWQKPLMLDVLSSLNYLCSPSKVREQPGIMIAPLRLCVFGFFSFSVGLTWTGIKLMTFRSQVHQ